MNNKILVVDDEKNIRTTLSTYLKSSGFEVELASDGEEALKKIKESDFLLVLLDIKMRGLSGMQVLEEMRIMGFKNNVVMMTAYGTIENAVETLEKKPQAACADSGFSDIDELEKVDKQAIRVIVPSTRQVSDKEPGPFDKSNFK